MTTTPLPEQGYEYAPPPVFCMTYPHSRQSVSFSPVVGIGTPPTPHPQARMPPPLWFRGVGHTRWLERGWESLNSDEGTYTVVLFKYMYFVDLPRRDGIETASSDH